MTKQMSFVIPIREIKWKNNNLINKIRVKTKLKPQISYKIHSIWYSPVCGIL